MKNSLQKIALVLVFCVVLGAFAALAYMLSSYQNPQINLAKLLINNENKIAEAFFSPDDELRSILIALIDAEQKSLSVAIYTLTDKNIAHALIRAHKRGIAIECVVDPAYGNDRYSKIDQLANEGIAIFVYQSSDNERAASLMHNKFVIFKENIKHHSILWTGSFNFTVRAHERNQENVVVLDNAHIIEKYVKQFEILKNRSQLVNPTYDAA